MTQRPEDADDGAVQALVGLEATLEHVVARLATAAERAGSTIE